MGSLNPGNSGFSRVLAGDYVDKTGLLSLINKSIESSKYLTCISRPRRFGKTYAAQMLCAYYDKSCDSSSLFSSLSIAKDPSYKRHLNSYDVIYIDMTGIKPYTDQYSNITSYLINTISEEIKAVYPSVIIKDNLSLTLENVVAYTGNKFVLIIDEWDAPIRENPLVHKEYLEFLRSLFKNSLSTSKIFAAAYMTGILPIKKDGTESAISDFDEYTMVNPRKYSEYVGFTEAEVLALCKKNNIDFSLMKKWYDGYSFFCYGNSIDTDDSGFLSIYNPNSVMKAVYNKSLESYWSLSSSADNLLNYISRDYSGLSKTIAELIGGIEVKVDTLDFQNDLTSFSGKDDVLTLLIHLGYLSYNSQTGTVHIPNEEIKLEFQRTIRKTTHEDTLLRLRQSDQLFMDTIEQNADAVALQIERIHREECSPLHYNKEDSLRSVIKLAYYTYKDNYLQFEELPSALGYADIVYLPKKNSDCPALVIELKWNKTAKTAIDQIKAKHYPDALKGYGGKILLVGVSYDKDNDSDKKHHCVIECVGDSE